MNREPSIHITKSNFTDICNELEIKIPIDQFFQLAKRRAIISRSITVSNNKIQKQVSKVLLADHGNAALFADLLYAERIKLKHKGVKKINEADSNNWDMCKKLADICNTFCNDFGLETRAGYIKYIEIGISRMNGNNRNLIQRLVSMSENIFEQMANEQELSEDKNPWLTNQGFEYYVQKIAKVTGIYDNKKDPNKLITFKRLGEKLQDPNKIKEWIDAQFYALAFVNGVPSIKDLLSDKALERYNKYLYKMKHREELPPEEDLNLWSKINDSDDDLPF